MSFFVEQGTDEQAVRNAIRMKYGEQAQILSTKKLTTGGFFGLFARQRVELTGYIELARNNSTAQQTAVAAQQDERSLDLLENVLEEIKELKKKSEDYPPTYVAIRDRDEIHETLQHINKILEKNEFSSDYREAIFQRLCNECTLTELDDREEVERIVLTWIAESISIKHIKISKKLQLIILIGPTGVGKTTTIAKLAALYGLVNKEPKNVRIITLDSYRIGAREQIVTYGEIMNVPTIAVETREAFLSEIKRAQNTDIIFVDTVGRSPLDFSNIADMQEFMKDVLRDSSVLLCLSATTKTSDIEEILRQFNCFSPESVILTKLDETHHVGNLISVMHSNNYSCSFSCTGQKVPQDIELANIRSFLARLEGFSLQREEIMSILEMKK